MMIDFVRVSVVTDADGANAAKREALATPSPDAVNPVRLLEPLCLLPQTL